MPLYNRLYLENVSTLALSLELTLAEPFGLCDCTTDDSFTFSKVYVFKKNNLGWNDNFLERFGIGLVSGWVGYY